MERLFSDGLLVFISFAVIVFAIVKTSFLDRYGLIIHQKERFVSVFRVNGGIFGVNVSAAADPIRLDNRS